jgi:phosphoribosylamine--glycine ligase
VLVWKLAQSPRVSKIYCAPGNGGIARQAELVNIKVEDIMGLLKFAKDSAVDLVVVGPEKPLSLGIVDLFESEGIKIFGPTKELAKMESSKVFAKELMKKYGVPTAEFKVFTDSEEAKDYIRTKGAPIVVKADGLAFGKGVVVAKDKEEALGAVANMMDFKVFGDAGKTIVIEECLEGEEASILIISDGNDYMCLASSQDHKRVFDDDKGPNTGGMGAYSPAPVVTGTIFQEVKDKVLTPVIKGLARETTPFKGVLYAGLMITKKGPKVLEFNVRFGDPEAQAILPRLKTDLVDIIEAAIGGRLADMGEPEWSGKACVCVVMASGGYPGDFIKGIKIRGLSDVDGMEEVMVFHAATESHDGEFVTTGGRVLGVTALGADIENAITRSYDAVSKISFEGQHYRRDIGAKAIAKLKTMCFKG